MQPIGKDFLPIERRDPAPQTMISSTVAVPQGTLLNVPSAQPTGITGTSPVVAVNTTLWYKDPQFVAAVGGALLALADPIVEALTTSGPFRWRGLIASCVLALVAYFRKSSNTVVKS
jgi:hypothetical protein